MKENIEQDEQQQEDQRTSSDDRTSDLADNTKSLSKAPQRAKQGLRKIKTRGLSMIRGGSAVAQGGTAATGVGAGGTAATGTAATSPAWGTAAVILLILAFIILLFIIVFAGGDKAQQGGEDLASTYDCPVACQENACTGTDTPDTNASCTSGIGSVCCVPEPPPGTQPPIKFYCQYDDRWKTNTCNIEATGCTPTSVAMIMASYGNPGITPLSAALANTKNGRVGAGCFSGSSAYDFIPWIKSLGYTVGPSLARGQIFNVEQAKKFISNGYYILSGANILFNRSLNNGGGHAFVIGDIDSNNVATVYDPTFCSTDTSYSTRRVNVFGYGGNAGNPAQPLLSNADGNYWFWAFPIKKL